MIQTKLAMVTGGTSGLGEALAIRLAEQKISLVLTGRDREKLSAFRQKFPDTKILPADLNDPEERNRIVEWIEKHTPDLLINAAGAARYGEVLEKPLAEELKTFELNAAVPIPLCSAAAKALIQAGKQGTILNISSIAADFTFPYMAMYASAKAALSHFSKSFHEEVKRFGIAVLVSSPGQIRTSFAKRASNLAQIEPRSFSMTKEYAADRILRQIARKKPVNDCFNWTYRAYRAASRILPSSFFLYFIKREMRKLYKSPSQ